MVKTKSFELAVNERGDRNAGKLAILIPGRLDTKDYINFTSHLEFLANKGYFAIVFDPPGIWESSGGIEIYNTSNYLRAVDELIEFFGNKPTLLVGHSRGGATSALASRNPLVTGIILIMANYGAPTPPKENAIEKGFQISYRDLPPGDRATQERKEFKLPLSYWEDGIKYDPLQALKECTKPKLLIYGTQDEFVPPDEVRNLYKLLPEPKMIIEIDCEHDYRRSTDAIREVEVKMGEFIDNHFVV